MRIVDNIAALRVHTSLTRTNKAIEKSTLRLSSGFRINSAGDDPAGFSISLQMRKQIGAMNMADRNTLDGTSLLQTADAALQDVHDILQRIRELAVQASNDTNSDFDRGVIQNEIFQLLEEIDDVTRKVEFNNIRLLNGETQNLRVQVGGRQHMSIAINIPSFHTMDDVMGLRWENPDYPTDPDAEPIIGLDVSTLQGAQDAIDLAQSASERVSRQRAEIGAFINRFEYTSSSLQATIEATSRSLSRVQDTDMAWEMMQLSINNVLNQAGMAIMAQVNARPQQILQLI